MNKIHFIPKPYKLYNRIQHYAWGEKNEKAFIPHFLGIDVEKDKPYAELWIGTHPNAPSEVVESPKNVLLGDFIESFPNEILGKTVTGRFGEQLPFLFKVLSAGEALSIQAHPNKKQAKELHQKDPQNYPDDNHKPEIAIALDELTALVGMRSYDDVGEVLKGYPELEEYIGIKSYNKFMSGKNRISDRESDLVGDLYLDVLFKASTEAELLERTLDNLEKRLMRNNENLDEREELFLFLKQKYGNDVGLWSLFLLNLIHLQKGQGVYLTAGVPHAYLKGNIIECMANSDNVVRVGLTPKFKDSGSLAKILKFECGSVNVLESDNKSSLFTYPSSALEFTVGRIILEKQQQLERACQSIQILLLLSGKARIEWKNGVTEMKRGDVIMIPAVLNSYFINADTDIELFAAAVPGK
jgi:mannose-6-phosphate isomerase